MSDNSANQSANIVGIFDRYSTKPKSAAPATPDDITAKPNPLPPSGRVYKAYGIDAPQKRPSLLAFHYANGAQSLFQKSYLLHVLLSSSQYLSLIFSSGTITLIGENLDQLVELLQDEKILSIHCFNPKIHDPPPEGEIFISDMTIRSTASLPMKKENTG